MYSREKIDDQRSSFSTCVSVKKCSPDPKTGLLLPGEFTGRRSETHLHKRKVEILRFRAKRELSSNLPPERKNRPEDRSVENFENGGRYETRTHDLCRVKAALQPAELTALKSDMFNISPLFSLFKVYYHNFPGKNTRSRERTRPPLPHFRLSLAPLIFKSEKIPAFHQFSFDFFENTSILKGMFRASLSSRGLGHRVFIPATRVRIPMGMPFRISRLHRK